MGPHSNTRPRSPHLTARSRGAGGRCGSAKRRAFPPAQPTASPGPRGPHHPPSGGGEANRHQHLPHRGENLALPLPTGSVRKKEKREQRCDSGGARAICALQRKGRAGLGGGAPHRALRAGAASMGGGGCRVQSALRMEARL